MSASDKRTRIFNFIGEFINDRGYAPSMAEIQSGCEISSKSVVEYHLKTLERLKKLYKWGDIGKEEYRREKDKEKVN